MSTSVLFIVAYDCMPNLFLAENCQFGDH